MSKKIVALWLVMLAVVLSGCEQSSEATVVPELETVYIPVVSVTGEVVPAVWTIVSAQTGGKLTELLVQPGDRVVGGDLLVQLDPTDAQLAVQQAEAAVETAEAQLALLKAGPLSEEVSVAEAQIEAAAAAFAQAAAERDKLKSGVTGAEIAAAQAQLAAAEAQQRKAWEDHDKTMECFQVTKPDGTKRKFCPALGTFEELARLALFAADEAVAAARAQLDAAVAGADDQIRAMEAAVSGAAAQQNIAQAQLNLVQAKVTAEEIAVAKTAIVQAQATLDAARVAIARCEVRAPISGTVGAVDVRSGEMVAPGEALITLGDLTTLRVETTDLDEIDVARVAVDQQATVTFDALPERNFSGHVTRISPMAQPGTGGVNYTVVIEVDDIEPAIRWGMTAFVDIEVE